MVNGPDIFGAVQVVDAEDFFDLFDAVIGQDDSFALFVGFIVFVFLQLADDFGELGIGVAAGDARGAEIISGVRASSIRMESTSSTMA